MPVEPLRDAFARSGISAGELARRLGWERGNGRPDASRAKRMLGLVAYRSNGRVMTRQRVTYRNAVLLANALHVDPVEVGV